VFVTAEGARTIVRNLGGKGFFFGISDLMTSDEADAFLETLALEDQSVGRG